MKSLLRYIAYRTGLRPTINKRPPNYWDKIDKPILVISADFELIWGWRFTRLNGGSSHGLAVNKAKQARENFPKFLKIFEEYKIPTTWATVGHLFLDSCPCNGKPHVDLPRPPYFENEYWRFVKGDWFDGDPCGSSENNPYWYAPDLVNKLISTTISHEIGCHSFSHIPYFNSFPEELVARDLQECTQMADRFGIELKSFVFPGNFVGHRKILKKYGFISYRSSTKFHLDYPFIDNFGLVSIPDGLCLELPGDFKDVNKWIDVLKVFIDRGIKYKTVISLWFHPSCDPVNVDSVLPEILSFVNERKDELWITTFSSLAEKVITALNG